MKTTTLIRISGMFLLALAVSVGAMILVYALQNPQFIVDLASIS